MLKDPQTSSTSYLIKQLPTATVFINLKFQIIHVSDKWISTFSQNRLSVNGQSLFKIFPQIDVKWKKVLQDCFKGNANPLGMHNTLDENKNEKWYDWESSPWYDTDENIIGAIIQINDITEVLKNELQVEKTETLLSQLSDISKIGRWEYDIVNNNIIWCNMTKAIHDVAPSYVPNIETAIDFYKEGHSRNAISMAIFEATDKGTPWNLKLQIVTATGKEKWVMAAGKPVYKKEKLVGLVGTFQDIHEQVETDMKTRESEKLLKTLIDNLPLSVFIKDTESRRLLVNRSVCAQLGVKDSKEILGKNDFDLYPPEIAKISRDEDLKVMKTLQPILGKEKIGIAKDGTETHLLSSKIPLIDGAGVAYGLVGICLDITNLKEKEKELRNLINVASLQNKKLVNFAHIVSHNLRSHSANFSMLLEFLKDEKNEEEKSKIVNMLTDASDNLLETLDNLNEVIAISTNTKIEKEPVNLNKRIIGVQQNLSGFLLNNQAKIVNEVSNKIEIKVEPEYLESILINFITNGVKYRHPDRRPIVRLSTVKKGSYTILSIEDNGLGIDLEKYGKKLFGMYKTFHNHKDAKGIGLYITKNQIEAMNGKIKVDSTVGKGTKFDIYFNEKN